MNAVLDIVTRGMNAVFDGVFAALSFASPALALAILSALIGVLMLYIWRFTSNQNAIKEVRNLISAHLLATRLFKDNLSVTFRAQRQIIWQALRLLIYSFKPMVIMFIPFVLLMAQIGLHYEFRPFQPGEVICVTATMKADVPSDKLLGPGSKLEIPEGMSSNAMDPCRAVQLKTSDWRLSAHKAGEYRLKFGQGDDTIELPVHVGDGFVRVSAVRGGPVLDRILYSAEPSIPASSIYDSIRVKYEHRATPILGYDVHWLLTLFVLSIVFALIFKPFLKVHI